MQRRLTCLLASLLLAATLAPPLRAGWNAFSIWATAPNEGFSILVFGYDDQSKNWDPQRVVARVDVWFQQKMPFHCTDVKYFIVYPFAPHLSIEQLLARTDGVVFRVCQFTDRQKIEENWNFRVFRPEIHGVPHLTMLTSFEDSHWTYPIPCACP